METAYEYSGNNFENIEIRDKDAGWIRTAWAISIYPYQTVRSKLEVRMSFSGNNELVYRVRVSSEIKENDCFGGDECFRKYERVLRKYAEVINELQNTLGSNL